MKQLSKEEFRRAFSPTLDEFREDLSCVHHFLIASAHHGKAKSILVVVTIEHGANCSTRFLVSFDNKREEFDSLLSATRRYCEI